MGPLSNTDSGFRAFLERISADAGPYRMAARNFLLDEGVQDARCNSYRVAGAANAHTDARAWRVGRLAYWICLHIAIDTDRESDDFQPDPRLLFRAQRQGKFAGWWAREVQAELFGMTEVTGFDDLGDLEPIRARALDHNDQLDRLEEDLVLRHARA